ncbi:lactoylglutathione lyase [Alkalihalobacillus alcalophilus ATCC 27647 = CGMCC 1.3604]|uniref:Lactoylglutathione lyase n=1 Tax=Alkalihalobacillus alcalophilus ATCC 27647 = CGMCC 1.3604 TaxID=1218173 RepID=A0A094WKY9_ALKAL|nr:VOC family protein [Alkalihalobacillus alcalophilus]KGA98414.1 lactoylglutathione lyase [Alkalihalobacillus alcalophilus ATCC 27647 = CGMCC 1.3604]MED1563951.1 VOC family protein [Alkalihalobacillus alcalophilus]THG91564.1 lactoylglutathione lyase [Alkalihalobacillus alcalophilus ATCC 27647 = CGMCC 1.3604]
MFKSGFTVWYNVSNMERTIQFYTEQLGFVLDFQDKDNGMACVQTNTKDCFIGFSEAVEVISTKASVVFEVEDIEAAVKALSQKGIEFTSEITTIPGLVKLTTFKDPDGHNLELSQTLMGI